MNSARERWRRLRASRLSWLGGLLPIAMVGGYLVLADADRHVDRARAFIVAPPAATHPIRGIDVSHHQGLIDWPRVVAAGQSFAFIKASEGADFRDRRFRQNWAAARAAGLATGAYHFFTFCAPGVPQADNFSSALPLEPSLPPAVDVEFTGNCRAWTSMEAVHHELRAFVQRFEETRSRRLVIYTELAHVSELIPSELRDRTFWLRSLWGKPRAAVPWLFWQYSAHGRVPGITGDVDLNVFAGERSAWEELVGSLVHERTPALEEK